MGLLVPFTVFGGEGHTVLLHLDSGILAPTAIKFSMCHNFNMINYKMDFDFNFKLIMTSSPVAKLKDLIE